MKLRDIFTQYEKCKLCGLTNHVIIKKVKGIGGTTKPHATEKKSHYVKDFIEVSDNEIVVYEEASYHVNVSELVIDIENNTCKGSEVATYEYAPFYLSIKICCPKQISREFDFDDDFGRASNGLKSIYESDKLDVDANPHYSASFSIHIDQKKKEIIGIDKVLEVCETSDFLLEKNYTNNKTKVIRKEKILSIPFLLEKDLAEFDFESVLNNTKLLK